MIPDVSLLPSLPLDQRAALPNTPAVYFAIDASGAILYIGKSIGLKGRWCGGHPQMRKLRHLDGIRVAWLSIDHVQHLHTVERACIAHFRPAYNIKCMPVERTSSKRQVNLNLSRHTVKLIDRLVMVERMKDGASVSRTSYITGLIEAAHNQLKESTQ